MSATLVIGIGNTLAGDDGIGARAVQELRPRPGVRTLVVHQLTPELAEEVAGAARVIFVDAGLTGSEVEVSAPTAATAWPAVTHAVTAAELLGLTTAVYDYCPEAFAVTVPGHAFGAGTSLSEQARRHFPAAVRAIEALL